LVNSGSVEVMDAPKTITLPESRVDTKPRETVVIIVSEEQVLVQGDVVALVASILNDEPAAMSSIASRLAELKQNIIGPSTLAAAGSREVTILADRSVPFIVIKRIMSTCTAEGYENVSLAVIQKASQVAAR
ncbi:MAG: biopolymer transporter ExbD, partial [Chloroflexi bacterium]|nr:biopolymer transporter ExbD [Chloroflexota bacterium]